MNRRTWLNGLAAAAVVAVVAACDDTGPTSIPDANPGTAGLETTPGTTAPESTDPTFASVTPVEKTDNPSCTDLGYDFGFKVDKGCPDASGTWDKNSSGIENIPSSAEFPGTVQITCNDSDNSVIDSWSSTYPIQAVIVKGGPNSNLYAYDPPSFGDTNLTTPAGGVSHVEFCYELALTVEKSATPDEVQGKDNWDLKKDLVIEGTPQDGPEEYAGFPGDDFTTTYRVSVEWMGFEPGSEIWTLYGTITIKNLTPVDATVSSISDVISGPSLTDVDVSASVDCPSDFPFVVAAGNTVECTYSASLDDGAYNLNTATVTTTGTVKGGTATAGFDLAEATVVITSVDVVDCYDSAHPGTPAGSFAGCDALGSANDDKTFEDYTRTETCPTDESEYTNGVYTKEFPNRAHIKDPNVYDDENVKLTCYLPASAKVIKTTTEGDEDIGQFPIKFELYDPTGTKIETVEISAAGTSPYTLDFTTELKDEGTWKVVEVLPAGWVTDDDLTCSFTVAFPGSADQTYTCEFANVEMSRVEVLKLTNGEPTTSQEWKFAIFEGPDGFDGTLVARDSTPPALLDFLWPPGDPQPTDLDPGAVYTLCELDVPASYSTEWKVDTNGDGVADMVIPPYNPNEDDVPSEDLGNRCVDFGFGTSYPLVPGETLTFQVDNQQPGGAPRTPGYWKNWNRCTGGGQQYTADANGGPSAGFWLLDDVLNGPGIVWDDILVDDFVYPITSCDQAVLILDKRDTNRRKKASDPFINLATALLAAQLNFAAGACTTPEAQQWALEAETLLDSVDFKGDAIGKKEAGADRALQLQEYLDDYNNGEFCGDSLE